MFNEIFLKVCSTERFHAKRVSWWNDFGKCSIVILTILIWFLTFITTANSTANISGGSPLPQILGSRTLASITSLYIAPKADQFFFWTIIFLNIAFFFIFKDFIYFFLETGEGKKRERNINVWLPFPHSLWGTWPATQASVLTRNRTGDPLVRNPHSIHWATPARAEQLFTFHLESNLQRYRRYYLPLWLKIAASVFNSS